MPMLDGRHCIGPAANSWHLSQVARRAENLARPTSSCLARAKCFLVALILFQLAASSQQQQQEELDNSISSKQADITAAAGVKTTSHSDLSRRIDKLEFELRKSLHQMNQISKTHPADSTQSLPQDSLLEDEQLKSSLLNRLDLVEKFITISTKKLYENEQRIKQLEKCDCRLTCKWRPTLSTTTTTSNNDTTPPASQVKMDGESWQNKCDVCSCHRGHVRCKHIECPKLQCPDPRHVSGKCCPVCFKPCMFKGQTIRHGNKLVINSSQNTCKECVCLDGRFRCQRVEIDRRPGEYPIERQTRTATLHDSYDADADEDDENEIDDDIIVEPPLRPKRQSEQKRAMQMAPPPLVCPQINCDLTNQFQLQNDCCTYCRDSDFCAYIESASAAHFRCHPNAHCSNGAPLLAGPISSSTQNGTLADMIECKCKTGFVGDGRHCSDIDECADRRLNTCDTKTSNCVNLSGSHRCKCKPGYVEPATADKLAVPTTTCVDLNECSDPKLNRCHPQAKCINRIGSYACRCKRGYLGNGFECHKWFSSGSNVAAYLHRHSAPKSPASPGQNSPLAVLDDDDDDDNDDGKDANGQDDQDRDQDKGRPFYMDAFEAEPATDDEQNDNVPRLSDSNSAPLQSTESFQQVHSGNSEDSSLQRDTISARNLRKADRLVSAGGGSVDVSSQTHPDTDDSAPDYGLNTRTMFFQTPPRRRQQQHQKLDNNVTEIADHIITTTYSTTNSISDTQSSNINNAAAASGQPPSFNDPSSSSTSSFSSSSSSIGFNSINNNHQSSTLRASSHQSADSVAASQSSPSPQSPGYKRGTIIVSATTSNRGYNGRVAHSSSYNIKSKALGVTSSSTSAAAGGASLSRFSIYQTLLIALLLIIIQRDNFTTFHQTNYRS